MPDSHHSLPPQPAPRWAWLLSIGLAGCGGTRAPAPTETVPAPFDTLTFEFEATLPGTDAPVALPWALGTLDGRPASFILDTGAALSVLSAHHWQPSDAPDLQVAVVDAVGGGGTTAATFHSTPPVELDGIARLGLPGALLMELGPHLEPFAGILSPQALTSPDTVVVLDFPRRRLSRVPLAEANAHLTHLGPGLDTAPPTACDGQEHGVRTRYLVLDATVDGHPARLRVDSGANGTVLRSDSEAALALASREDTRSIDLSTAVGHRSAQAVGPLPVALGSFEVEVPQLTIDGTTRRTGVAVCDADGLLGLDVLARCALIHTDWGLQLACS